MKIVLILSLVPMFSTFLKEYVFVILKNSSRCSDSVDQLCCMRFFSKRYRYFY